MEELGNESGKILIIDDTVSIINMVKTALLSEGYQILIATSGENGIKSAKLAKPDLILLDILMPEMDGYETCRLLKADDETKDIPVLFMSALTDVFDKVKAFKIGAVDYVTKPLNVEELQARVNTQVRLSKMQKKLKDTNKWLEEKVEERTRELKESNQRYKTVADYTYDWEYWILPDGNFEYISPSCKKVTGYSAEDFINNPDLVDEIIHPEDKKIWNEHQVEKYTDETKELVFRIKTKEKQTRWIGHVCRLVYDENGKKTGIRVSNRDITNRIKAENEVNRKNLELKERNEELLTAEEEIRATNDELRDSLKKLFESEERYKNFIRLSSEGIHRWEFTEPVPLDISFEEKVKWITEKQYLAECNDAFAKMYGCEKAEELIGKGLADIEKSEVSAFEINRQLVENNFNWTNFETEESTKSGERRYFLNNLVGIIENDKLIRLWGTQADITKRKQAALQLKAEKDKAQMYLDIAGVMIVAIDVKGDIALLNQKGYEILGVDSNESITGKNWFENFIPETIRKEVRQDFDQLILGHAGVLEYYENEVLTKKGEERIIAWHNTLLRNNKGEIIGTLSSGEDITARRFFEKALNEEQKFIEIALDNQIDTLLLFDPETETALRWNKAFKEISGYTDTEIASLKTPYSYYSSKDLVRFNEFLNHVFNNGEGTLELELIRKDGDKVPTEYKIALINDKSGKQYMISVGRDITERKIAEEALKISENNLSALVQNSSDVILSINQAYHVIIINDRGVEEFKKVLGVTIKPGQNILEKLPDKIAKLWKERYDKAMSGEALREEDFFFDKGTHYYSEVTINPIYDGKRITGAVIYSKDITERRIEENIKAAQYRLIYYANNHSSNELLQKFLDEAEELTKSEIGFYHFLKEDQETISLQAWSTNTLNNKCKVMVDRMHYPISMAGVWVDCVKQKGPVIHNDYASLTHKKGMPEGHAVLIRELVVPVFIDDKIVALLGVGNKKDDYNQQDVKIIQRLAELAQETVVRKQAQEFVLEEKKRVTNILQATNAGTWDWNLQTGETRNDERWADIIGYKLEELQPLVPDFWQKNMHPDDTELTNEILEKHLKGESDYYEAEFRQKHKNGSWVWVMSRGKVIEWSKDGKPLRMYGTHTDISKRKRAEIEIVEREERFKNMFYHHTSVMLLIDPESGYIADVNNAALVFYGYKREQLKDLTIYDINILDRQKVFNEMQAAKKKNRNYFNFQHKLASGEIRDVQIYSTPVTFLNKTLLYSIVQDITEQRKAEEALKESEKYYRMIFEESPILFWEEDFSKTKNELENLKKEIRIDLATYLEQNSEEVARLATGIKILDINQAVYKSLGLKNKKEVLKKLPELFTPKSMEAFKEALLNLEKGINHFETITEQKTADGKIKTYILKSFIPGDDKSFKRVIVAMLDITELIEAEKELEKHRNHLELLVKDRTDELEASNAELAATNEELHKQKEKLERTIDELNKTQAKLIQSEKMASLGVLVAGVAHEINNPVNFINSSLVGLKNNLSYLNEYGNLYHQLLKNADAVADEIKQKEKEASFQSVLEMFKRSIEIIEVGIERTTKIVKGLKSFARSDEKNLEKYDIHESIDNTLLILYNQFKDRVKITREFEELPAVECFPGQINQVVMNILTNAIQAIDHKGQIKIKTSRKGDNHISIEITDTGNGIPADKLKHIFDPFYTTKDVGKGTGLGLSISYGIVRDHNGEILVESELGKGTTFKILLPVKQ